MLGRRIGAAVEEWGCVQQRAGRWPHARSLSLPPLPRRAVKAGLDEASQPCNAGRTALIVRRGAGSGSVVSKRALEMTAEPSGGVRSGRVGWREKTETSVGAGCSPACSSPSSSWRLSAPGGSRQAARARRALSRPAHLPPSRGTEEADRR